MQRGSWIVGVLQDDEGGGSWIVGVLQDDGGGGFLDSGGT